MPQLPPAQSPSQAQNLVIETGHAEHAIAHKHPGIIPKNNEKPLETGDEFATVLNIVLTNDSTLPQTIVEPPISLPPILQDEVQPKTIPQDPIPEGRPFAIPIPSFPADESQTPPQITSISQVANDMNPVSESFNSGTINESEAITTTSGDASSSHSKSEIISNSMVNEVSFEGADSHTNKLAKAVDVKKSVTSAVVDTLVQQVETTDNGVAKKIVLQLHPAELGQVTLQVDWENDSLRAKILTNEAVASEILNQNKQELVAALSENGLNFDSLDVAYQQADDSSTGEQDNNPVTSSEAEQETNPSLLPRSSTSIVDIVI